MKYLFFLICLMIYPTLNVFGQFAPVHQQLNKLTIIDTAKYVITYKVKIISDKANPDKIMIDEQVLQIGNHMSKVFSNLQYKGDSTYTALIGKGVRAAPWFQELVPPIEVYKNYPTGKLTVTHRTFLSGPILKYEEPVMHMDWKILPERKKIFSYSCQKATTEFRGRKYEAWFTSQIPLKEGPYKFQGLPGLILEIMDTQEHYVFTCVEIKKSTNSTPILLWEWETQKTTKDKLNVLLRRFHETPATVAESLGIKVSFRDNSGNERNKKSISYPYNPIELE